MPVTRHGPVMNLDTEKPVSPQLLTNTRITRSTIHRILKQHGIKHHAGLPLNDMINLMHVHNVPFNPVPAGMVKDLDGNVIDINTPSKPKLEFGPDGFPKNYGKFKKLCKEKGIKFPRNIKRPELVALFNQQLDAVG